MANFIAPGVYSREIDQSIYATQLSTTTVGMVGLSKKGVVNVPTLVTNMNQFIEKFGEPTNDFPYSGLAAEQYFNYGNTMYFTRVVPMTENGNLGAIHARLQEYSLESNSSISGNTIGIPDNQTNLRWDFADVKMTTSFNKLKTATGTVAIATAGITLASDNTITISLGTDNPISLDIVIAAGNYSRTQLLAVIDDAIEAGAPGIISVSISGGKLQFISSYDMTFDANSVFGFTTTPIIAIWTKDEIIQKIRDLDGNERGYLSAFFNNENKIVFTSPFDFSIVDVTNNCNVIYPVLGASDEAIGTINTDGHRPIYGTDYKMSGKEMFQVNASANTMTLSVSGGSSYKIVFPPIKQGSYNAQTLCEYLNSTRLFDANESINWDSTTFDGAPPVIFIPKDGKIIMISTDTSIVNIVLGGDDDTLGSILGYAKGDVLTTDYLDEDAYVWFPMAENAGAWGNDIRFRIWYSTNHGCVISIDEWNTVLQDWDEIERHTKVVFDESEADAEYTYAGDIDSIYLMFDPTGNMINETDPDNVYGISTSYPQPGTYYLSGGTDGDIDASAIIDEIVGTATVNTRTGWATGLQTFSDPEKIDVNTIIVPYFSQFPEVWSTGITLCTVRNECEFLIDTPQGLTAEQVVDWANGSYGQNDTSINSSFAACYWPWQQYYDSYNDKKRWMAPSGLIAGQYAYNDQVGSVYNSAAGLNRGRLLNVLNVEYDATLGERIILTQNGVNCIVDFVKEGVTIWDDITTLRKSSALKDNNIRRGLNYVKKVCASLSKYYCFEPNDEFTWNSIKSVIGDFLGGQKRAFRSFKVQCDNDTNSNIQIDNGIMRVVIYLEFIRTAKIVQLDFTIMKTGGITVLDSIM